MTFTDDAFTGSTFAAILPDETFTDELELAFATVFSGTFPDVARAGEASCGKDFAGTLLDAFADAFSVGLAAVAFAEAALAEAALAETGLETDFTEAVFTDVAFVGAFAEAFAGVFVDFAIE